MAVEALAQVSVAHSVYAKFGRTDSGEEVEVVFAKGIEPTDALAFEAGVLTKWLGEFAKRLVAVDGGVSLEVSLGDLLGNLSTSGDVGNALAKRKPTGVGIGSAFRLAVDTERAGVIEGTFGSKDAAVFVVKLD